MENFLPCYALGIAALLTIGETLVVLRTNKYWPLSLDDYLACGLLTYSALTFDQPLSPLLMLMTWGFMSGNLYAMLFTRMDPDGGSRERLPALALMLILSLVGATATLIHLLQQL
jgi:hypothetical protein